jgi:ribosomal protein S18 acetylase RimI-like enzyme
MKLVASVPEVVEVVNRVKAGATAFTSNLYPSPARYQAWIDHQELLVDDQEKAALFFRKDRHFLHFFFCAADQQSLAAALSALPQEEFGLLTTDVVGTMQTAELELQALLSRGFLFRTALLRLCRPAAETGSLDLPPGLEIGFASAEEVPAALALLEELFDPLVYQVPVLYELAAAARARQILVVRRDSRVIALLFFETQGVTSTLRFWAVSPQARSTGLGSALLRRYLQLHPAVRRFVLWVDEANQNARDKYARFGYSPDGLMDHILISPGIRK